jgi:predicted hotdog family 3-hydroxylacyl-ACP dehydratase
VGAALGGLISCYEDRVQTEVDRYPPPVAFMPHRPPMLMIDALLAHSDDACTCTKTFRADDPLVEGDGVSALVMIELFAQTAAAHFGYAGFVAGGAMTSGALLGTRKIELAVGTLPLGQAITIVATRTMAMPPMAQFECEARLGDRVIATGSINVAMGVGGPPKE